MYKIFIDGEYGTTGLQLYSQLQNMKDIEILSLPKENYKDLDSRVELAKQSDITVLCLPDNAALEISQELYKVPNLRVIDCSTAHRIDERWIYGFAEMTQGQYQKIAQGKYISNPGCYPTGALSIIRPLRDSAVMDADQYLAIYAVSGYSGGGKNLINQMTDENHQEYLPINFFSYAMHLSHKHNKEIKKHALLNNQPVFMPNVVRFRQGMMVNIGLHINSLKKLSKIDDIRELYKNHYKGQDNVIVASKEETNEIIRIDPTLLSDTDKLKIFVFGNEQDGTLNLCAILDNLGKGASGAAIQNIKIMLGMKN